MNGFLFNDKTNVFTPGEETRATGAIMPPADHPDLLNRWASTTAYWNEVKAMSKSFHYCSKAFT